MEAHNLWTSILAVLATGLVTFLITRASKNYDARAAAEAALIGTGPAIIAQMNERARTMQAELTTLWDRDRECQAELRLCREERTVNAQRTMRMRQRIVALERFAGISYEQNGDDLC